MLITGQEKGQLLLRPLLDSPMVIGTGPGGHSQYANLCAPSVIKLANSIAAPTSSNRLPLRKGGGGITHWYVETVFQILKYL